MARTTLSCSPVLSAEHERFVEVCGRAFVAALRDGQVARVVVEPSKSVDVPYLAIERRGLRDLGIDIDDLERERPKCERVGDEPLVAGLAGVRERLLRQRSRAAGVVQRRNREVQERLGDSSRVSGAARHRNRLGGDAPAGGPGSADVVPRPLVLEHDHLRPERAGADPREAPLHPPLR